MRFLRIVGPALVASVSHLAMAQSTDLRLTATVRCWEKGDDSTRFTLTATDTTARSQPVIVDCTARGRCRVNLALDHVYRVEFSAEGHVPKHVIMDLDGPGIKQRKWGYDTRFRLQLMPRIDSVDFSICERPLALARFDPKENQFTWDERYTFELTPYYETMQNRYVELTRDHAREP